MNKMQKQVENSENAGLPLDKLPPEWQDADRLNVLYGALRSKQVNPRDLETKLAFWKQSLQVYCSHNSLYSFNFHKLQKCLLHKGRSPLCLQPILEELLKSHDVVPLDEFLYIPEVQPTWSGWAAHTFLKRPLSWTFHKVKSSVTTPDITKIDLIHVIAVQNDADDLYGKVPEDMKNQVIELSEFASKMHLELDQSNLKLLLHHLVKTSKLALKEIGNESVILLKFPREGNGNTNVITDIEADIFLLGRQESLLEKDLGKLEDNAQVLKQEILKHLKDGRKPLAMAILHKKKLIENRIKKRSNTYLNVIKLLEQLKDTMHSQEIHATYKSALANLRMQLTGDLDPDKIDDTMTHLGDVLDIHNEIQSSLGQDLAGDDDDDLESELAELMAEEDDAQIRPKPNVSLKIDEVTKELDDLKLPDVPTTQVNEVPEMFSQ